MYSQSCIQSSSSAAVYSYRAYEVYTPANTGLSRLKISGYANNELRIQLSTTPQSQKKLGDRAETRHAERRAKLLAQIEFIRKCQAELLSDKQPEIWIPQGGAGITTSRIDNDICEIDNRIYAEAFKKSGITPSGFDTQVRAAVAEWQAKNFSYPIPIDFTPVTKEVFKKWDKQITPNTEWIDSDPDETNLFYRAVPCCDRIELPVSRVSKLPGTGIKVTWQKHTISMAECERILAAAASALDIIIILQEITELGCDNPQRSFGKRGRHTLLESGAVVDTLAGLNAVVVTLTLPGSTKESMRALAAYSSWIVNSLFQVLRDWRKKYKRKIEYFYVWEFQKRGALHLHICLAASPDQESLERLEQLGLKMKNKWFRLLLDMGKTKAVKRFGKKEGKLPGIDMFARNKVIQGKHNQTVKTWRNKPDEWQWDVMPIKKSVAAYFAKYAGKGNAAPTDKKGFETYSKKSGKMCYAPSRWWGVSKVLMEAIKANRFEYVVEIADLQSSSMLEAIHQQLALSPITKAYGYNWQVLESKYIQSTINGKQCYCEKGFAKGELEPLLLASQAVNPTRILIKGITEIYYFEPQSWAEHWRYWKGEKDLIYALAGKPERKVVSSLRV